MVVVHWYTFLYRLDWCWKPSKCRDCFQDIQNGEPRVGTQEPSWQFEGMMKRWMHLPCALNGGVGGVQRITQLKGVRPRRMVASLCAVMRSYVVRSGRVGAHGV
jgi:hypothetical protein